MSDPGGTWIDLLDPRPEELRACLPPTADSITIEQLLRGLPRPLLESHGEYVIGAFVVPVAVPKENDLYYQEIELVLTHERLVTIRTTPPGRPPYDPTPLRTAARTGERPAFLVYRLADDVADRYLAIVADLDAEIAELEDAMDDWDAEQVGTRLRQLRYQILHVRRIIGPMRDAVRAIVDGRIELVGEELFTRDLEHGFASVHDLLLRAIDGLDLSRDLLAAVRDHHQARIANNVNDVVRRLTVIASLILVPTFIVGLYGQNFAEMPEFGWGIWGYVWSWGLILATTIVQLWYFRRRKWL
jgi:magnesium transporter